MKIVIAGGNGFIGQYLQKRFLDENATVLIIARTKSAINWQDDNALKKELNKADLLINLAGKSINCRYTKTNKAAIFESRLTTTNKLLINAINRLIYG